jgi:hypothetical protein
MVTLTPRFYTEGEKATWRRTPSRPTSAGGSWLKVKVPKYREEERGFYKP